jgi:hypothetical protein
MLLGKLFAQKAIIYRKEEIFMFKTLCFSVILLILHVAVFAGGIRGTIRDEKGEPLAYATIFVKQTGSGTATNVDGNYELSLAQGSYEVVFQYLGYQTFVKQIEVGADFVTVDVVLTAQATVLQTVTIKSGKEDPAYTIMRKAIAKANYHRNQLDEYQARVYIKGSGQLKDYPWLAKRQLEKEGIEKGRVFVQESVSDIKYTRPNKFEEKVISIRTDGSGNENASPNQYIFGSFYEPVVAQTISPLSPKAFSYYRFEYQGTFKDRDYEISKIKVIPRSRGDNVVEGMLYLVENWWSIHSMDIKTTKLGISFFIKAVYAPIEDKAWLPVSHQFRVEGKIFGFEFEGKYMATVRDYKIKVNPELYVDPQEMEVVDEKIEKAQAEEIEKQNTGKGKDAEAQQLQERLAQGKEITRKELKTLIKEYEKQEVKELKEPEVVFDNNFSIDSGAYKHDSTYWAEMRPIPLTKEEIKGYQKSDSLAVIERKKSEGDTTKASKHKGFQPWDILIGDSYKVSEHSNFRIYMPFGGFNTVEGWNIFYKLGFGTILQDTNKTRLNITPTIRYAFSREAITGNLRFTMRNKKYSMELEGGRYVQQLNHEKPIHPIVNTFTTLMLEKNLMKLYERDYIDFGYRRRINAFYSISTNWSFARRYQLYNNSDFTLVDRDDYSYTTNIPYNEEFPPTTPDENGDEVGNTAFPTHEALIGSVTFKARPWLKYRMRNGQKHEIDDSSPTLSFEYRKGFADVLNSSVDFDQVELGFRHEFDLGVRAHIDVALRAGAFLNNNSMYFMDYQHFLGNKTPFSTSDPVGSFRLLDYYRHSTSDKYLAGNVHYQFRRFLVTSIPQIRMMGIRENIFVNYLATPSSRNYTEVGYSIDGILRIFRLEGAASFQDGKFLDYGFRVGIATNIDINFND